MLDEKLHGYSNYRFSEYPAGKHIVFLALRGLLLDGSVQLHSTSTGYSFSITEAGKDICRKLISDYAGEYRIAVQSVISRYDHANAELMFQEINRLTVQSLKKIGHE